MLVEIDPQQELVNYTKELLIQDRMCPDIGMGLFIETAICSAKEFLVGKYGKEFLTHINTTLSINTIKRWQNRGEY